AHTNAPSAAQRAADAMTLRSIQINNGELSFYDARRNLGWAVAQANLRTALTSLDAPMRIDGDLSYNNQHVELGLDLAQPRSLLHGTETGLKADIHSELLEASFDGQAVLAGGEFSGTLRANGPNLRQLAAWWATPITGGVGLEDFAVSGQVAL